MKSKEVRIPLLILGFIPLLANHVIESNLVENLYLYDSQLVLDSTVSEPVVLLDKKSQELQEINFDKVTSYIEVALLFILITSLGVIVISNFSPNPARKRIWVRVISFSIVVLFLMPLYGDKHPNYGGIIHTHFIWEGISSYAHIH